MDGLILRPRGADGFATSTDVANLKAGITDGDAHLFISGSEERASIPC